MDTVELKKIVGKRFRSFRESLKLSQSELAQSLNVKQSTISQIEAGMNFPGMPALSVLADQYALNVSWLLAGRGEMLLHNEELLAMVKRDHDFDKRYLELLRFMKNPTVEFIIFAKMLELQFKESQTTEQDLP